MSLSLQIGPYLLQHRLNVGGTSEVFRAKNSSTGEIVTLKRLLPSAARDKMFSSMFYNEQRILKDLDVEGVPRLLESAEYDREQVIVLEYIDGPDIRSLLNWALKQGHRLPVELTVYVTQSVAQTLSKLHGDSAEDSTHDAIVHRDISPDNILLSNDGRVWLIDFGLGTRQSTLERLSLEEAKSGKWSYMSPEQQSGNQLEKTSDLFSLAATCWEMLTTKPPFQQNDADPRASQLDSLDPPSHYNKRVPSCLDEVVMHALRLSPSERYTSASEFARELSRCAQRSGVSYTRQLASQFLLNNFVSNSTNEVVIREETHTMAENKGGSDLDVFEGLARKPKARSLSNPPTSGMPPLPGSRSGGPPPPARARTLLGMAPPLSQSGRSSLKAPTPPGSLPLPSTPGLPPPPKKSSSTSLPAVSSPPSRSANKRSTPAPKAPLPPTSVPPLPGGSKSDSKAAVEMDWDDEDEKTHVYDKQSKEEVAKDLLRPLPAAGTPAPPPTSSPAAALLARSGSVAPPMPKTPEAQPSSPSLPSTTSAPPPPKPPVSAEPTMISERRAHEQQQSNNMKLAAAALAVLAIIAGAYFMLRPKTGTLKIYVSGPHDSEIPNVQIYVDNKKECDKSPCTVNNLSAGVHDVKAEAKGYESAAPKGADVIAGKQSKVELELRMASQGTGLKAQSPQKGVKLFVDGKEIGELPQDLRKMSPGEHKLKFVASKNFAPLEKTITVVPNQMVDLGQIKLKVVKGKATLKLSTKGARILLVSSTGDEKQVDERMFRDGKFTIEVDTSKKWHIKATKKGFDDLSLPIEFEDGQASKTFVIELKPKGENKDEFPKKETRTSSPTKVTSHTPTKTHDTKEPTKTAATGPARLNINSIPPSAVLIDGRPVGRTPKSGVVVSPGRHTITFIHPEKGRKSTSVMVRAGQTKGVGLRL